MAITWKDNPAWMLFVRTNHNQDQLAYSSSGSLGFTFAPLYQLLRYTTGYQSNYLMVSDPIYDAFYTNAMAATSSGTVKQIVRDANEYVARQHFAVSLLKPQTYALYQPWLVGYNGQNGSISGFSIGPTLLGFYASRFYIDQNLKYSMGY